MRVENFRDLAGLQTTDGKKIKPHKVIRSAKLSEISWECIHKLQHTYHLKTVVDLRRPRELAQFPNILIPEVNFLNIDILEGIESPDIPDHLSYDTAITHMEKFYDLILHSTEKFSQFLKILLHNEGDGAVLFHCHHGKDRTGLGAAIFLKVLGVPDEVIFDDYLKTIEARKADNDKFIAGLREKGHTEIYLDGMHVLITVRKEYLEFVFDSINCEFGSFENFIREGLSITDEEIIKLKEIYLEP